VYSLQANLPIVFGNQSGDLHRFFLDNVFATGKQRDYGVWRGFNQLDHRRIDGEWSAADTRQSNHPVPPPPYTLTVAHATATHNLSEGDYSPQTGSQPIPVLKNTFDINMQKSCSFATMHIVKRAHLDTDVTAPSGYWVPATVNMT